MGHKKDECEKRIIGIPFVEYDARELRCSPYKKFVHRSHSIPPAGHYSSRRELSFLSFGSAESREHFGQGQVYEAKGKSGTSDHTHPRSASADNDMPPLADDIIPRVLDAFGNIIG
jgi:hypothetical protein